MSKLNKCSMLSSYWKNGWILMALPLELALSGEPCSHQPCADQHISNGGTRAPSHAPPPHCSSLLPVSFLKGIVLLFWQKSSRPLGIHWKSKQQVWFKKGLKIIATKSGEWNGNSASRGLSQNYLLDAKENKLDTFNDFHHVPLVKWVQ